MWELLIDLAPILQILHPQINTHCTIFEDNLSAHELANTKKFRTRTMHIAIKYHHSRDYVQNGMITIRGIDNKNQLADIFTKTLPSTQFKILRHNIQGWICKFNRAKYQNKNQTPMRTSEWDTYLY